MPEGDHAAAGSVLLRLGPETSLNDAVGAMRQRFADAGLPTPALDARVLAGHVLGIARLSFVAAGEERIGTRAAELAGAAARRLAGEPVARIIGEWEFYGLQLELTRATLVPRADTETLVDAALARMRTFAAPRILDLGTGSGAILLALLSRLPDALGVGVDIAPEAAAVARRNAGAHGLGDRAAFLVGCWGAPLAGGFDLVVANPPYICSDVLPTLDAEVRLHDPLVALDGGHDGLDAHRAIARDLRRLLTPSGIAVVEIGWNQGQTAQAVYAAANFAALELRHDLGGHPRALVLRGGNA